MSDTIGLSSDTIPLVCHITEWLCQRSATLGDTRPLVCHTADLLCHTSGIASDAILRVSQSKEHLSHANARVWQTKILL